MGDEDSTFTIGNVKPDIVSPQVPSDWRKELEDECDCYHGRMSKARAASLLEFEGDFLVREARDRIDRIVKPVLSLLWNDRAYHFLIKQTAHKMWYVDQRVFDTIASLIVFHRRSGLPISRRSGALLVNPISPKKPESWRKPLTSTPISAVWLETARSPGVQSMIDAAEKLPLLIKQMIVLSAATFLLAALYACICSERAEENVHDFKS
ncbi:SH2 domain-containing protein [Aphelenchoides besseyi]|nr:SH2 domain-containing protein [Aphelenchoides besseyi]